MSEHVLSRRGVVAGALAALGAPVGRSFDQTSRVLAANGDPVTVGNSFTGSRPTTVEDTSTADSKHGLVGIAHSDSGAGVMGQNLGHGAGIFGSTADGVAVSAQATGSGVALAALS